MSAHLIPKNPSPLYPRYPLDGKDQQCEPKGLRLSWQRWGDLVDYLESCGIDARSLSYNRQCGISKRKCEQVAAALADIERVPDVLKRVAVEDVLMWWNSGGFRKV